MKEVVIHSKEVVLIVVENISINIVFMMVLVVNVKEEHFSINVLEDLVNDVYIFKVKKVKVLIVNDNFIIGLLNHVVINYYVNEVIYHNVVVDVIVFENILNFLDMMENDLEDVILEVIKDCKV